MAYIKIFPIKVTDKKALDYITNPDKTDEKLLVSSFGCSPETADLEFSMTREMAKKNGMDKGDNLAFHLIQSFKPGEVDAETAHRLGQQFANEVLKGKYEYVISTHVDKNHIHNHIIFNAASFVDHHKYVSNKRSYHKICRISNRICQENGLATSMPTEKKGKSYKENMEYHRGTSWKAKLRVAVDKAIWASINYEEFLQKMQLAGYEVRQGKHLSFRAPEQKNFTYMKSLGSYDSEENVRIRLATLANAALIQCQQLGYQVPDDVSIIGFDDLPIAAYTSPPLTTIRQDRIELGKSGFFALSSLLNGVSISTFLLHTQLIERKSTGTVPQIPLMISPL